MPNVPTGLDVIVGRAIAFIDGRLEEKGRHLIPIRPPFVNFCFNAARFLRVDEQLCEG